MLINTVFYIAAFHFSPTNTALTLSVSPLPPLPFTEVMAIVTIQFPRPTPAPLSTSKKTNVKIIWSEIQTQRVLVLVTFDLIDTDRV